MKNGFIVSTALNGKCSQDLLPKYILITPARNEEAFIEQTIKSVINQTVRPVRWVIVSDGSTDATDGIVKKYASKHKWIDFVRMPERKERHFGGKVHAFNAGYAKIKNLSFDVIGSLDADISFEEDYMAFLLSKFADNPQLGLVGTPFREGEHRYDYRFTSIEHVSGACQLFKRECFEEIGGYKPIEIGGVDLVANLNARMMGWQTRTFPGKICVHHRKMGTAKRKGLVAAFGGGRGDYILGMHPVWEFFRSLYQMSNKPFVFAGGCRLAGFVWAMLSREKKAVPKELVEFRRKEQMQRLKDFFMSFLTLEKTNSRK